MQQQEHTRPMARDVHMFFAGVKKKKKKIKKGK